MKRVIAPDSLRTALALPILMTAVLSSTLTQAQTQNGAPAVSVAKAQANADGKLAAARIVTLTAVVESKDEAARSLVLRGPRGRTVTVLADSGVKNFDAINVGDKVSAKVSEAVTVSLRKGGDGIRESAVREGAATSDNGMPGAAAARMTTIVANVWAIDRKKNVLSVRGPKGNVTDINVDDPARLKDIRVGDQLEVKYVEAVALGLTRLPK